MACLGTVPVTVQIFIMFNGFTDLLLSALWRPIIVGDERHLVFECPHFTFSTMIQSFWQDDLVTDPKFLCEHHCKKICWVLTLTTRGRHPISPMWLENYD